MRGFMSSVSGVLHIGLGEKTSVDSLQIRWSDGQVQVLTGVAANQTLTLKQADARPFSPKANHTPLALMQAVTGQHGIDFTHKELLFNDFQYQPLLPHGFSQNGPPIAVGDLNGDGLEDFYVGGGKGQAGRIFYQKNDGNFANKDLTEGSDSEDTAALIFDANGDGKNDLYVVSGSSEWEAGSPFYQDRLYLNTGNGNLDWAKTPFPKCQHLAIVSQQPILMAMATSICSLGEVPNRGAYPTPARSYLLRNDGGKFSDVTATVPGLGKAGHRHGCAMGGFGQRRLARPRAGGRMDANHYFQKRAGSNHPHLIPGWTQRAGGAHLAISDLDGDGDLIWWRATSA
ncbi:MAG: ASPIC/UnbV domain-containing protein [Saprospiraceae bacterium]|nr:ASPIC/UnbV domain-containing protein [Saprospiraceae bacterium]